MTGTVEFRRDTAANLAAANRVYGLGEPVQEIDKGRWKIADGTLNYNDLPYQTHRYSRARNNNSTDDTTQIQGELDDMTSGGVVELLPGSGSKITAPLVMNNVGTVLVGPGRGVGGLRPSSGFSGASLISVQARYCGVQRLQMQMPSSTVASNPAASGIVSNARYTTLADLDFQYVNGYAIEILATSSQSVLGSMIDNLHLLNCAGGVHTKGHSAQSSYGVQAQMSRLNLETCTTLPCLFIEDSNDVQIDVVNGAAGQNAATNSMIHVKGGSTIQIGNPDCGVYPGPANAPTMLVESGATTPNGVKVFGGVLQAGSTNLSVTAGSNIQFDGVTLKSADADNADISGGTVLFSDCIFKTANQGGHSTSTTYDLNISGGTVYLRGNNQFQTGGLTTNVNDPGGHLRIGFGTVSGVAIPNVTGSRGSNAALASLLTSLANLGLLTDSST